jgi:hypothetical protein
MWRETVAGGCCIPEATAADHQPRSDRRGGRCHPGARACPLQNFVCRRVRRPWRLSSPVALRIGRARPVGGGALKHRQPAAVTLLAAWQEAQAGGSAWHRALINARAKSGPAPPWGVAASPPLDGWRSRRSTFGTSGSGEHAKYRATPLGPITT